MNVDIVNVQSFPPPPPIFSLAGHFFYFQNKVGDGERGIFAFDYVVKLVCKRDKAALIIMSVSVLASV